MIYPKCKNNRKLYIAADGQMLPCCFISAEHKKPRYYEKWHTKNNSVEFIAEDIKKWADNLEKNKAEPFDICNAECGNPSSVWVSTHLELSTRCTLQCPKCPRTKALDTKNSFFIGDVSFENAIKTIDATDNERIQLCGSFGDPIFYPRLKDIVKHITNSKKYFTLNTAAPGKSLEWWKDFYQSYDNDYKNVVVFGLDGLENTAHLYRKGTDFNQIFETMKLGVSMSKHVVWQWIPFSFNEHQIKEAKELAMQNNIEFRFRKGDRWSGDDDPLKPKKMDNERGW